MDQPGKVTNPIRGGQLNRENEYFPVRVRTLRIWSRETVSAVPSRVSLLTYTHNTQAESGAYLQRDYSRVPKRRPFIYLKTTVRHRVSPVELIGSRNCVSMAFTAKSLPAQGQ